MTRMADGGKRSYKYKFLIYVVYVLDLWPFVYDFGSKMYKPTHKHTSVFIDGAFKPLSWRECWRRLCIQVGITAYE